MLRATENQWAPILLLLTVALVFGGAGFLVSRWTGPAEPLAQAAAYAALRQYPEPRVVADFALVDAHGARYDLDRWKGHDTLVFFGFTHCPDICPGTLGLLKGVIDELRAKGLEDGRLQVHLVSVDPDRDSPAQLKRYIEYFDPHFQAATGPHPQLAALTRQLGILYTVEPHETGATGYQVDHSASVLLIDANGRLAGAFPAPLDGEAMTADLARRLGLSS